MALLRNWIDCGRGIGRSGPFSPHTPVLVARADNNDHKDGRIIGKEKWEKTRRGQQASTIVPRPSNGGRSAWDMMGNDGGAFWFLVWRIIGVHGLGP
jgi:hypothetical protein